MLVLESCLTSWSFQSKRLHRLESFMRNENSVIGNHFFLQIWVDDLGVGGHQLSLTTENLSTRLAWNVIGVSGLFRNILKLTIYYKLLKSW